MKAQAPVSGLVLRFHRISLATALSVGSQPDLGQDRRYLPLLGRDQPDEPRPRRYTEDIRQAAQGGSTLTAPKDLTPVFWFWLSSEQFQLFKFYQGYNPDLRDRDTLDQA